MTALTPMGALPGYLRIAETLAIDIGAGRLSVGDKLPPERVLAGQHGVSVTTLRKALRVLADRGLIAARHGSGHYVTGARDRDGTYALFRLERHPEGGGLPGADLISVTQAAKPCGLPDTGGDPSDGLHIRRLRRLDGIAVALEDIWLEGRFARDLRADQLSVSLYKTYRDRLGLRIQRAEDRVRVAPLPAWAPDAIGIAAGTQMGLVDRRAFDEYGTVAEVSQTWFDPARARYLARVP
jgi:GntR family transcriptional regulator